MTIKWNRESILVLILLLFVTFGGFYYGEIYFLREPKAQAESSQNLVEQQKKLLVEYPADEKKLQEVQKNYEQLLAEIPEQEALDQELLALQETVKKHDMTLRQLTQTQEPTAHASEEGFFTTRYELTVTANRAQEISEMIERLYAMKRVWKVSNLQLTQEGAGTFVGKLTVELIFSEN